MRRLLTTLGIALVFVLSCDSGEEQTKRVNGVVRVFKHETNHYSFLIKTPGSNVLSEVEFGRYDLYSPITIYEDAKPNEDIWYETTYTTTKGCDGQPKWGHALSLAIHVHSAKEINGAGWNHGKFGSGTTTVVE